MKRHRPRLDQPVQLHPADGPTEASERVLCPGNVQRRHHRRRPGLALRPQRERAEQHLVVRGRADPGERVVRRHLELGVRVRGAEPPLELGHVVEPPGPVLPAIAARSGTRATAGSYVARTPAENSPWVPRTVPPARSRMNTWRVTADPAGTSTADPVTRAPVSARYHS